MELPPNQQDKGFFTEGVDAAIGKRKASLTDTDNAKAQRIQTHARRAHTPEPAAKDPEWRQNDQLVDWLPPDRFGLPTVWDVWPGGDRRRADNSQVDLRGGLWDSPNFDGFQKGPGPYFPK